MTDPTYPRTPHSPQNPHLNLYTAREAAKILRIGYSTLARMRMSGTGPVYSKIGNSIVYSEADLVSYHSERRRYSTVARAHPETGKLPGEGV